jgi:hypothetical protein
MELSLREAARSRNSSWSQSAYWPAERDDVRSPGITEGIRNAVDDPSFQILSMRDLEYPVSVTHLRDVIQSAGFPDEIELDPGWRGGGFQYFEEPRESLRTDTQPHRVLSGPFLDVPHRGLVAVLDPHATAEAARLYAGGRCQQPQGMNNLVCATCGSRQRNSEAYHVPRRSS